MNYTEALDWLYTQLPMFQRIGAAAYKNDLTNTIRLCNHFNNPQNSFPSIHIAGTNGKGSTSHMLASILQESGYKVGLYTSPHLKSFTERIKINGKEIDPGFVTEFVANNASFFKSFDPSFFEITVAMAFSYFEKEKVDIAVIETGLGGRLDSTNIITPLLSVITNIGWDHTNLLGDSLPKIAFEKAGIIKKNIPVVIGENQPEVAPVFIQKAEQENAPLIFASDTWKLESREEIMEGDAFYQQFIYRSGTTSFSVLTDQLGLYQEKNVATVLTAIHLLRSSGWDQVSNSSINTGFKKVTVNTGLMGRWQILDRNPWVIADVGHNEAGIRWVLEQLRKYTYRHLYIVWGSVNDKDVDGMLSLLPLNAYYLFSQASIPRALDASALHSRANLFGLKGEVVLPARDALQRARMLANADDLIFVGGSTFIVSDVL